MAIQGLVTFFWGTFFPLVALAASPRTFSELAFNAVDLMGYAIGTLVLAALVLYFFGSIQHLIKLQGGSSDSKSRQTFFLVGIIILFVMVSVWGILGILENTLLGTGENLDFGRSSGDAGFIQTLE